jgi:uncharacterized protein with HEPN domain
MDSEIKVWLYDILNAIMEIDSFFTNVPKEFTSYKNDLRTRRAVERNIEIIGEALNRIISKKPDIKISNARKIVDTRNRIIHGYDSVSDEIIWGIVINHIPVLQSEVEAMIGENESNNI